MRTIASGKPSRAKRHTTNIAVAARFPLGESIRHHAAMTAQAPLAVGLVGAGPWAAKAYAPMLAAGPETRLSAVWARRPEAAAALAAPHGADSVTSFDALLERCDAVAFAVPPDIQCTLGSRAARAGKHLMLDKPLGLTLEAAQGLADAVAASGVVTQLMLTQRFRPGAEAFLAQARAFDALGARAAFLSGAFVRGPYATTWRRQHGSLHDLGPHAFDLLDAALGPIEHMSGAGDPCGWLTLACRHAGGAISELSMSGVMNLPQSVFRIELYGPDGAIGFDAVAASADEPWSAARRSFAEAVRAGRPPVHDIGRGLVLQRYIDRALRALR